VLVGRIGVSVGVAVGDGTLVGTGVAVRPLDGVAVKVTAGNSAVGVVCTSGVVAVGDDGACGVAVGEGRASWVGVGVRDGIEVGVGCAD
jgi:hypothetical protein